MTEEAGMMAEAGMTGKNVAEDYEFKRKSAIKTMKKTNTEKPIIFQGQAGDIEALFDYSPDITTTAIVCHPHPLFEGTMHNKVVTTLVRLFSDLGLNTLRFNFRGVGASAGEYAEGLGETEDVLALISLLKQEYKQQRFWLAGFSFGSFVAFNAAGQSEVEQLLCVAPAVTRLDFSKLALPDCPITVVQGGKDEVVDPTAVFAWCNTLPSTTKVLRFAETGHFFHGKLIELREKLEHSFGKG